MKKVFVNAGRGYGIIIENNTINKAGELIRSVTPAKKACVVSDTNVFPLYGSALKAQLEDAGFESYEFVFRAGEESKTPKTVISILEYLADNEFTREDIIIALGGGVTGDMAGFAASVYLRGIDYVQIPTSLLAQVDSSVGGKTAVDLPQGKNLCGAFHHPLLVIIDTKTLETLPPRFFSDGMAEAIKTACIKSASLFDKIENENAADIIEEIIYECVSIKAGVVERDEKEHGERALLNFGHTAGHAIEKLCNFSTVTHGEAVGIGMVLICRAAEENGLTEKGTADRLSAVLKKYSLKTQSPFPLGSIISAMSADKKRKGGGINFVLIKRIGEGYINPIKYENINSFFGV